MSFLNFVVSNGRLLIIGGILLLVSAIGQLFPYTSLAWAYPWTVYALVVGMGVVTAGLLRLFADLNPQLNLFGRVALLAAAIGGAVATVGWLLMLIAPSSFFGILMAGWMLHLMGVSVFGGYAVTTHLLPRWNFTLLIGSAFPLLISLIVFQGVTIHSTGIGTTESSMITTYIFPGFTVGFGRNWGAVAMLLLIGFGWVLSGLALERKSDAAQTLTVQHS